MGRPKIPNGTMTITKARKIWGEVRKAAQGGDPEKMLLAVSRFEGVANTMFQHWDEHMSEVE